MRFEPVDFTLGIVTVATAGAYLALAAQIPHSLLSDEVGASGLPNAVGWTLVGLGAVLAGRSLRIGSRASPTPAADAARKADADDEFGGGMRPHWLALGLLAMLYLFVVVTPLLGYIASTALLLGSVALFSGAPSSRMLAPVAVLGAVALWLLFDAMLSIPLPVGSLWSGS